MLCYFFLRGYALDSPTTTGSVLPAPRKRPNHNRWGLGESCAYPDLPIHPIQSALGQKVEAKLVGSCHRERCQGRAVMSGREVAGLAGVMGLPMGLNSGRVSPFRTKSVFPASTPGSRAAIYAVSGMLRVKVLHAVT